MRSKNMDVGVCMKKSVFLLVALFPFLVFANEGRINTMDCSKEEVAVYLAQPDPERAVVQQYGAWESAYQSFEMRLAAQDPRSCLGLLYGDLTQLADRVKAATQGLMALSVPSMSGAMSGLGDKLLEGICSRVESASNDLDKALAAELNKAKKAAESEIMRRYGMPALEKYVTEAVVPPEYQSMGLRYRNGEVSTDSFRQGVRSRWSSELDELRDNATGN